MKRDIPRWILLICLTASAGCAMFDSADSSGGADGSLRDRPISEELAALFAADQADRSMEGGDWSEITARDGERRARVLEIVQAGQLSGSADYFHAAMILQHGDLPEDYLRSFSPYAQHYDGKVSFADERFLAPLVDELSNLGLLDDTIIVLWSDHGEDLHEIEQGRSWGHNWSLAEQVMRTVLIMKGPGIPPGNRHEGIARSIDIFPTLVDLAGIPPLPQFEGESLVQDGPTTVDEVYMENLCQGFAGLRHGKFKLVLAQRAAVEVGSWRWKTSLMRKALGQVMPAGLKTLRGRMRRSDVSLWCPETGEPEDVMHRLLEQGTARLYDLEADPDENHDLAASQPETVAEMKGRLSKSIKHTVPGSEISMSDEEQEQLEDRLRGLGYL